MFTLILAFVGHGIHGSAVRSGKGLLVPMFLFPSPLVSLFPFHRKSSRNKMIRRQSLFSCPPPTLFSAISFFLEASCQMPLSRTRCQERQRFKETINQDANYLPPSLNARRKKVRNQFGKGNACRFSDRLPSKGLTNEAVREVRKMAVKTKMVSAMAWALEH